MSILSEIGIQQWRLREPKLIHGDGTSALEPQADVPTKSSPEQLAEQASKVEVTSVSEAVKEAPNIADVSKLDAEIETNPVEASAAIVGQIADQEDDQMWETLQNFLEQGSCESCQQGGSIQGEGDSQAEWLFLMDAPNADALKQGQIVSGRARRLYEAILAALKLDISQVYTTSVFKCAPSEDIALVASCQQSLVQQITLLRPKVIVCLGEFSAQALLKSNDSLASLREQQLHCIHIKVPVIATHSLPDLLRSPILKSQAWSDYKRARAALINYSVD